MTKPPDKTKLKGKRATGSGKNKLNDADLWNAYASKVTPLTAMKRNLNIRSNNTSYPEKPSQPQKSQVKQTPRKPAYVAAISVKPLEHGKADGLDRTSQKKMRRGKIEIEARLDLHGMVQVEAHAALLGFLERAYQSGKRSVLVITGKGLTRHGDIGVLRKAVPKWLNEAPVKNWIRGFDYAAPADGGEGALYILLRRKR